MGLTFKADHLTCPACGAATTPLNRPESNHERVTHLLAAFHPGWDPEGVACEECVNGAYGRLAEAGIISPLRNRFRGRGKTQLIHRYRTTEKV